MDGGVFFFLLVKRKMGKKTGGEEDWPCTYTSCKGLDEHCPIRRLDEVERQLPKQIGCSTAVTRD
jgi:hypothetical protein